MGCLIMNRTRGISGPMFQKCGNGKWVKGVGIRQRFVAPVIDHQYNYSTPAVWEPTTPVNQGQILHTDNNGARLIVSIRDVSGENLLNQIMLIAPGDIITVGTTDFTVTTRAALTSGVAVIIGIVDALQIVDGEYTVTVTRP